MTASDIVKLNIDKFVPAMSNSSCDYGLVYRDNLIKGYMSLLWKI